MNRHNVLKSAALAAVVASAGACGLDMFGPPSSADMADTGHSGWVALQPHVEVVGMERLAQRSGGAVVLQHVLLNAVDVRVASGAGASENLAAEAPFYLRYSPVTAGAAVTPLWVPACDDMHAVQLQVAPEHRSLESLQQESLARGFDVTPLQGVSLSIRGVVGTGAGSRTARGATAGTDMEGGEGCVNGSCENTIPDTAPATGGGELARKDNGTVPDTAPARMEGLSSSLGLATGGSPGVIPRRERRLFEVTSTARFDLWADLDPALVRDGGTVRLRLDVNALFTDESLAALAAAGSQPGNTIRQTLTPEDLRRATRFAINEVMVIPGGVRPR